MNFNRIFAEEFLQVGWTTYALVELDRDSEDEEDSYQRVDSLSSVLFSGSRSSKERAVKLLGAWLKKYPKHQYAPSLKLRRIMYLHKLGDYAVALKQVEDLLKDEASSAALYCLRGNILGHMGRHDDAIREFDIAIELEPSWSEPRLEKLERIVCLGRYAEAVNLASDYSQRANSEREQVIVLAIQVVARALDALNHPMYIGSEAYENDLKRVENINIPLAEKENWNFQEMREQLVGSRIVSPQFKTALCDRLTAIEKKLEPPEKGPGK